MKSLTAHIPPPSVRLVGYSFPGKPEDLDEGENWQSPEFHGAGVKGEQIFAHDLGVMKYNPKASDYKQWRFTTNADGKPTDGLLNEHFRVWKKQVYAIADGEVIQVRMIKKIIHPKTTTSIRIRKTMCGYSMVTIAIKRLLLTLILTKIPLT